MITLENSVMKTPSAVDLDTGVRRHSPPAHALTVAGGRQGGPRGHQRSREEVAAGPHLPPAIATGREASFT